MLFMKNEKATEPAEKGTLSPEELADRWKVSEQTLAQWRWIGRTPFFLKMGKKVVYRLKDIEAYEEKCLRANTAQKDNSWLLHA